VCISLLCLGVSSLGTFSGDIGSYVDNIKQHGTDLQTGLDTMNTDVTSLKNKCTTDGETFCSSLPSPNPLTVTIPEADVM